jgi:hypothetical protein
MANEQNLKPQNTRTKKEQRAIATMGGVASGVARREKKNLRDRLLILSAEPITSKTGETREREDVISLQLINKAIQGDLKAIRLYAELTGQLVQQIDARVNDRPPIQIVEVIANQDK